MQRLDKFLSSQGLIKPQGGVRTHPRGGGSVNGRMVRRKDCKIDPQTGRNPPGDAPVVYQEYLYLMMNKPAGVLSASRDSAAPTVVDLVPAKWRRKGPVSRRTARQGHRGAADPPTTAPSPTACFPQKRGVQALEARSTPLLRKRTPPPLKRVCACRTGKSACPPDLRVLEQEVSLNRGPHLRRDSPGQENVSNPG